MARRLRDAISATSALAALIIAVGATGTAVAATGGTFILGKSNSASSLTTLSNSKGTALSLKAPSGSPALAVSNAKKIARLNADLLDNLDSTKFQRDVTQSCAGVLGIQSIANGGTVGCSAPTSRLFTTPGSYAYLVPAGVHKLMLWMQGAGGGGGGGGTATGGGGGGSGSLTEYVIDVTPGESLQVNVGAGGTGGAAGQAAGSPTGTDIVRGITFVAGGGNGNSAGAGTNACGADPNNGGAAPPVQASTATGVLTLGGVDGVNGSTGICSAQGIGGHKGFAGGGGDGGGLGAAGQDGKDGYVLIQAMG